MIFLYVYNSFMALFKAIRRGRIVGEGPLRAEPAEEVDLFYPITDDNFQCVRCGAGLVLDCFCDENKRNPGGSSVYYCGGVIIRPHKMGFRPRIYRVGARVEINRLATGELFLNINTPGTCCQRTEDILVDPVYSQIIKYVECSPRGNINNMSVDITTPFPGTDIAIKSDHMKVNIGIGSLAPGDVLYGCNDWVVSVDRENGLMTIRTRMLVHELSVRRVFRL